MATTMIFLYFISFQNTIPLKTLYISCENSFLEYYLAISKIHDTYKLYTFGSTGRNSPFDLLNLLAQMLTSKIQPYSRRATGQFAGGISVSPEKENHNLPAV